MPILTLTGAAGFIGARVAARLAWEQPDRPLRLIAHRRPVTAPPDGARTQIRTADLADPASLRGVCDGADVLVHCASQIGGPPQLCRAVNADGTAALVAEAIRAGVRRIVLLSTASVYGRGPFRGEHPGDLRPAPASDTSRTRADAERAVLDAGGVVLRPHLVYGAGDRWVGPGMLRLMTALDGSVGGWQARASMIDADDLARAVAAVALAPDGTLTSSVYHANHPRPVPVADVIAALAAARGVPVPGARLTHDEAVARLERLGRSAHDLDVLAVDHCFASDALWHDTGRPPGPGFPGRFPRHADWYASA
ncbi:NAD-dependent epimerase/dehydratase family protein [Streptomyces sp. SL13]|uniref:NAD-dependent epimerase/dehydratase family protein n=1 Tax=Streptantibioticus silvisoli TaxID=2705255 RepID=A0AA90KIM9_9ACTN|nr:NAD-dependent epimerase/dehydratase family protein [Streptantibioticus silvisoli]MDI5972779.1 NAD-dependent epimerase/dehydratase family protein [Streptantibioticus silvisoli]